MIYYTCIHMCIYKPSCVGLVTLIFLSTPVWENDSRETPLQYTWKPSLFSVFPWISFDTYKNVSSKCAYSCIYTCLYTCMCKFESTYLCDFHVRVEIKYSVPMYKVFVLLEGVSQCMCFGI